jgi:hypothetical protein
MILHTITTDVWLEIKGKKAVKNSRRDGRSVRSGVGGL